MNANELADELENKPLAYGNDIQEWLGEAATMLRQQQAEIDSLRKNLDVALMIVNKPELTDEEIKEVWKEIPVSLLTPRVIDFARATLKKASKK